MGSFFSEEKALHLLLADCHSIRPQLFCNLAVSWEKNIVHHTWQILPIASKSGLKEGHKT